MRFAILFVLAGAAAAQATVTNSNDAGPGSLRAALTAANATGGTAPYTIDVVATAVAAPIVLSGILPALNKHNLTIRPLAGAGRLVIDARAATASSGSGLELAGTGIQVLVPLRVLVGQGHGVLCRGSGARLVDLETTGNRGGLGLGVLAGADNLVVGRLFVDTFNTGLLLTGCRGARVADDSVSVAECRNCTAGFEIVNGSDHWIGSFVAASADVGIRATNSPGLRLGRAGNPRGQVTASRQQGILLQQCNDTTLTNADISGNGFGAGGHGVQVIGGARLLANNLRLDGNFSGGMVVEGSASAARIGPLVSTRGVPGGGDVGFTVRHASAVTVVDCTFGPQHRFGVRLEPDASGIPHDTAFCRCTITGNREIGLSLSTSADTLVSASAITGNSGDGVEAVATSLATAPSNVVITATAISGNAGNGILAPMVNGLQVGPGCRVDDNSQVGMLIANSPGIVIRDNLSVDRNRNSGIAIQDCDDAVIARTQLRSNRGNGIWGARCTRLLIGPNVAVRDMLGTGIQLEGCDDCRVFSSQVTGCTGYGVHVVAAVGRPGTQAHLLQSCLLADNQLALVYVSGPPLLCQQCTITGNLRGVTSGANPLTVDSCIVWGNAVEDLESTATGMTVRNSFHLNPPPFAPGNTNANPQFVAPTQRDWRLQNGSPAIGYAHPSISPAPGAVDAFRGSRANGPLDAGAYEVGPRLPVPDAQLTLASNTMAHLGGGLGFQVQYLPSAVGTLSILCMQLGPPSGSFPAFGAVIPIANTPALLLAATDIGSVNTFTVVPPGGLVQGALLWGGQIPANFVNVPVSLCAVALDGTPLVRAVSNVATFTIQ